MRDRGSLKKNILLILLILILLAVMGYMYMWYHRRQVEQRQRLEALANEDRAGTEFLMKLEEAEASGDGEETEPEEETSEDEAPEEETHEEPDAEDPSDQEGETEEGEPVGQTTEDIENETDAAPEETGTENPEAAAEGEESEDNAGEEKLLAEEVETPAVYSAEGITCWGDDLTRGEATKTDSLAAELERLLTENGYTLPVQNNALQGGGTLSMMKKAGVADDVLQGYIDSHREKANGAQLYVTETGIRDFTEEDLQRDDLSYIPVIFMGYYGGWNHDPQELIGQQENILKTFPDQEHFIIAGTRPMDGSVSTADYDAAMYERWGEHYVSLAEHTTAYAETKQAQTALAEAVFAKLQELGYIERHDNEA